VAGDVKKRLTDTFDNAPNANTICTNTFANLTNTVAVSTSTLEGLTNTFEKRN